MSEFRRFCMGFVIAYGFCVIMRLFHLETELIKKDPWTATLVLCLFIGSIFVLSFNDKHKKG